MKKNILLSELKFRRAIAAHIVYEMNGEIGGVY